MAGDSQPYPKTGPTEATNLFTPALYGDAPMSYLKQLGKIATAKALALATGLRVVDVEVSTPFDGGPQEPAIFVIVETEVERTGAAEIGHSVVEQVHRLLSDGGYPLEHARTAYVEVVSRQQIQAGGGKEAFFR
jgi:hypothetical protein